MITVFDEILKEEASKFIFIKLPEEIKNTENFIMVNVLENDNLMSLAHRHFGTVDLWYILYMFNENLLTQSLSLNNFDTIQFFNQLKEWFDEGENLSNVLEYDDYHSVLNTIIAYFMDIKKQNIIEAIENSNNLLKSKDDVVIQDILDNIEKDIINSVLVHQIKVPMGEVISDINRYIKQYLEDGENN